MDINPKDEILAAARRIMVGRNTGHFTLEAVAREVGISKCGLLRLYPNKEALMSAIIQNMLEQFDHAIQNHLNEKPPERKTT